MHGSDNTMDYLVVTPEQKKKDHKRDDSFYFVPEVTQKGNIYFPGHPKNKNFNIFTLKI
jgi:hypothetical protein